MSTLDKAQIPHLPSPTPQWRWQVAYARSWNELLRVSYCVFKIPEIYWMTSRGQGRQTVGQLVNLDTYSRGNCQKLSFFISIFLDREKAHNRIWRYGLLRKLYAFRSCRNLPSFIQNFISSRTFAVKFSDNVTFSNIFVQSNGDPTRECLGTNINSVYNQWYLTSSPSES